LNCGGGNSNQLISTDVESPNSTHDNNF